MANITVLTLFNRLIFAEWIRNLVLEGIEPNPGPSWKEFEKQLEVKLGTEDFLAIQPELSVLKQRLQRITKLVTTMTIQNFIVSVSSKEIQELGLSTELIQMIQELFHQNDNAGAENLLVQFNKLSIKKKFTVNGGISDPVNYFYVDFQSNNDLLMKNILEGNYVLLQGPRGIGKTTRCYHAIRTELTQLRHIWTSLQAGYPDDPMLFWSRLGKDLWKQIDKDSKCEFKSAGDLVEFFESLKIDIVWFVDEFDVLLNYKTTIRDDLLNALRAMKDHRPHKYHLKAFVGIGPCSILELTNSTLSPFNVSDTVIAPKFTEDQITDLFKQYQSEEAVELENEIIKDICQRTGGHSGLVCFCGKQIQEELMGNKVKLTYSEWIPFAVRDLAMRVVNSWATVGRLSRTVSEDERVQQFLINNFLHSEELVKFGETTTIQMAKYLAAEGVLEMDPKESNCFKIPSPLIRAIILAAIPRKLQSVPTILPIQNNELDLLAIFVQGLPYFNTNLMKRAPSESFKKNRAGYADVSRDAHVPCEHCYHVELALLLRNWLPEKYIISTEVNAASKSCDIMVTTPTSQRYLIELVAHSDDSDVISHYNRVGTSYKRQLNAKEAWVVNFTTRQPSKRYVWPEDHLETRAIHIWHDLDWKSAKLVQDKSDLIGQLIKLDFQQEVS
mmetsp:Transcript_19795/g.27633  ORF Transcript_19795/g.27633 Transcript_19795/m.27633 type:complete len:670 (-) Transcript_19795:96-2105(-)